MPLTQPSPSSSHFTYFLYASDVPLSYSLVVVPRMGGFAYILGLWGPFQWTLLRDWQFLPPLQPPLVFTARDYDTLSSWLQNPGLHGLAWGWDGSLPRCPSQFLYAARECGTARSASCCCLATTLCPRHPNSVSLPFLPIWINISTLKLSCWTSRQFSFLAVLIIFVLRLVVILLMIVQGGQVCLLTPPSWAGVLQMYKFLNANINYIVLEHI